MRETSGGRSQSVFYGMVRNVDTFAETRRDTRGLAEVIAQDCVVEKSLQLQTGALSQGSQFRARSPLDAGGLLRMRGSGR